jgi:hypothetical protein
VKWWVTYCEPIPANKNNEGNARPLSEQRLLQTPYSLNQPRYLNQVPGLFLFWLALRTVEHTQSLKLLSLMNRHWLTILIQAISRYFV